MAYAVAALVAGALGALEQYNRLQSKLTKHDYAWAFWLLRIALEVVIGLLAMRIAISAKPAYEHQAFAWIVAGASGPALVRSRIIDVGPPGSTKPAGLAAAYEPFRDWIAARLDDIGAAAQSLWLNEELLPTLARHNKEPLDIANRLMRWVEGSERFTPVATSRQRAWVRKTLRDSQPADIKREQLVIRAVELKAYRVLRDLRRSCK